MPSLNQLARDGWFPKQHGAWAMLLAPLGVGIVIGGADWRHIPLAVCWIVGFGAFYATGLWLRSRRKPKYLRAIGVYGAISAIAGFTAIWNHWTIAWWAVAFAPLLATSLWCSHTRRDRTILNDSVTVLAACLMALVATSLGSQPNWARAVPAAIALFAYFEGTVFYVKTMIRERGNAGMWRWSVSYHALCMCAAAFASWWLTAFFAAATLRAWLFPRYRLTPRTVGLVETGLTVVLITIVIFAPMAH